MEKSKNKIIFNANEQQPIFKNQKISTFKLYKMTNSTSLKKSIQKLGLLNHFILKSIYFLTFQWLFKWYENKINLEA